MPKGPPVIRFFRICWDCPCGEAGVTVFDMAARPHSRSIQCPECGQALEIRQPIVLDLGKVDGFTGRRDSATGESPKGDPR